MCPKIFIRLLPYHGGPEAIRSMAEGHHPLADELSNCVAPPQPTASVQRTIAVTGSRMAQERLNSAGVNGRSGDPNSIPT